MTVRDDRERIALVVHEVRSPTAALAAIADASAAAAEDKDSLRSLVELSLAACRSIDRLLSDSALGSLELERLDIAAVVRGAVVSANLGGARVRAHLDAGLPLILGDRVRLRQALDNLIENAVTASVAGGEVEITARANEQSVVIDVTDRGDGIPVDAQGRIFEAGVRLAPRSAGSGLGLAIVRSVVEGHGGTAAVESSPGKGATFTIVLPIKTDEPVATDQPAGTASSS
jgi:signal transduction histidine kinase